MKKFYLFALAAIAILSFGGNILSAHAQTVSPADAAALQQSLDVMKAKLINLEMQAGMVPSGDADFGGTTGASGATMTLNPAPAVSTGLSSSDVTSIQTALSALQNALASLSTQIGNNPQLSAANQVAVLSILKGIGTTLASINSVIANGGSAPASSGTGIAQSNPSPASGQGSANGGSVTAANPPANSNPTPSNPAPASNGNSNQTAQASSLGSFIVAHWPTILIILLVIVILAILLWPEGEDKSEKSHPVKPIAPTATASVSESANKVTVTTMTSQSSTPTVTVVPSAPKVDVQQTKVTVVRPPEIKKKPA